MRDGPEPLLLPWYNCSYCCNLVTWLTSVTMETCEINRPTKISHRIRQYIENLRWILPILLNIPSPRGARQNVLYTVNLMISLPLS